MKDWGTVTSTKQPEAFEIDDFSVWAASEIKEVEMPSGNIDGDGVIIGYKYRLIQYTKDEYIMQQAADITEAQKGLCELYEMMLN